MHDERLRAAGIIPPDVATHWTASRKEHGQYRKLDVPGDAGLRVTEWPIDALTLDFIKKNWGAGEYKLGWFVHLEDDTDPRTRHPRGHSMVFRVDAEAAAPVVQPPASAMPPLPAGNGFGMAEVLNLMQWADQRAERQLQAFAAMSGRPVAGGPSDELASLKAELAATNARLEADKKEREIEQKHRDELAAKEREIADLKRKAERLEEEADRDATPTLEPGQPLLTQLGFGMANALIANPEKAAPLVAMVANFVPGLGDVLGTAQAPPPAPTPPVRAVPQQTQPRPVAVSVVPCNILGDDGKPCNRPMWHPPDVHRSTSKEWPVKPATPTQPAPSAPEKPASTST